MSSIYLCLLLMGMRALTAATEAVDPFASEPVPEISSDTQISTEEPKVPAGAGIEQEFPIIGKVKLMPTPEGARLKGMQAKLADPSKKLELGALTLDDATIVLADSGKLSLTGRGTLLNKSVRVGVKEYKDGRLILEITYINHDTEKEEPLSFEFIPGNPLQIRAMELKLEKGKPIEIRARVTLFGVQINMFFVPQKGGPLKITAKIKQVTVGEIISAAKNTPVDDVLLKDLSVTRDTATVFKGTADLTKLLGSSLAGDMAAVETRVTLDKAKGSTFESHLKNVSIPGMGALTNAKVIAKFPKTGSVKITLEAGMRIDIPQAGSVPIKLSSEITKAGVLFSGAVEKDLAIYDGKVAIKKAEVSFDTKKKSLSVEGDADVFGLKAVATIIKDPTQTKVDVALTEKQMYPFKDSKIAGLTDVSFSDVHVKYSKGSLSLIGTVGVLGGQFNAELDGQDKAGKKEIRLTAKMQEMPPKVKGSFIEAIKPTDMYAVLTNYDYTDPATQLKYIAGINLGGMLNFTDKLEAVGNLVGKPGSSEQFTVALPASLDWSKIFVNVRIPTKVPVSKSLSMESVIVSIGGGLQFQIKLGGTIFWKPSPKEDDIIFGFEGAFHSASCFKLAGSYEGHWKKALGIPGLDLEKLGLSLGGCAVPPPAFVLPDDFGVACAMAIGGRELEVMFHANIAQSQYACAGTLKPTEQELKAGNKAALSINDLIKLAEKITKTKIDTRKVPTLELENFQMLAAPQAVDIAHIHYDSGMLFKTEFNLFGVRSHIDVHTVGTGMEGIGYIDKIKNGAFSLTGTGPTGGPVVALELSTSPKFAFNGDLRFGDDIKWVTNVQVSATEAQLEVDSEIKVEDSHIRFYVKGIARTISANGPPDFYLKLLFENTMYDWVYKHMKAELDKAADKSDAAFRKAIDQIQSLDNEIKKTKQAIKERKDWLDSV